MMFVLGSSSLDYPVEQLFQWQEALGKMAWHWVEAHGYIAIFSLLFFSGLGLPLPEDVPLIAAGVSIARGGLTWAIAAPVAWVAMMFGDSALYIIGYIFGWRVVHLPVIGRHVSAKRLDRCKSWFDRWGVWAVGIGRMFAGIRTAMVVTAGTMRFNYGKLLLADGLAAIISGGGFMILGYWAGTHARPLRPLIEEYRRLFGLIALAAAVLLVLVLWWQSRKKSAALAKIKLDEVAHPVEPM